MPETERYTDSKKCNEDRGLNATFGRRTTTEKEYTAIFVNSNAVGALFCDGEALSLKHTAGVVVVEINLGDVVYIRTHPQDPVGGAIPSGGVAFYSYLTHHESNPGHHQTIVFDSVITNVGGNYNRHTGTFFCPANGVYTFSWTLYCSAGGHIYSEIVVNSNAVGAMRCSGEGANTYRHTTSVVVVEINQGDAVYIRTHPTSSLSGYLPSGSTYRSSFSGWKLF
ncbi:cerebellin-3-like [Saccostrea cucullata]|uniref:cerebellin-3-like n=1 Tax=Saccostrea cuccullata TaxID=36930 RepID=UPI002ED5C552